MFRIWGFDYNFTNYKLTTTTTIYGNNDKMAQRVHCPRNVAIVQERGCLLLKALVQRGGRAGHQLMMGTQGTRQIEDAMNANKDSPPVLARAADALQAITIRYYYY